MEFCFLLKKNIHIVMNIYINSICGSSKFLTSWIWSRSGKESNENGSTMVRICKEDIGNVRIEIYFTYRFFFRFSLTKKKSKKENEDKKGCLIEQNVHD